LINADRGYDPVNLLTARVSLPSSDLARHAAFADAITTRMRGVAGVVEAAAGNALPFISTGGTIGFSLPSPANPGIKQEVQTLTRLVSPTYFQTLRLRLLQGRLLTDADTATSRPVVVVNRSFAERYLGASPLGATLPFSFGEGRPDCDVVGVVEDMRQSNVTDPATPELFVSYRQMPARLVQGPIIVAIRTTDDQTAQVAMLRTAVREQDVEAVLDSVMTMDELAMTSLARPRLYAALLAAFGGWAVVIAGVGLFGVLSYSVTQRSREIGVRTALGAQTRDIVALVLKQAAAVAVGGLLLGLAAALVVTRLLTAFLYGVTPYDAISFVLTAAIVTLAAGIACLVPARRAARVDPLVVLRST
jgi:putative ABC transport system permease protein